jgi:WD40 repeat protein
MKFSPNDDLLALRSRDMPYYVFIYDLTGQRTVIIETTAKVTDFDWLHSNDDQPHTLCIISEDHTSFRIWKDTCLEGFSFK